METKIRVEKARMIHDASIKILNDIGVAFYSKQAIDLFSQRGFKIKDSKVFFCNKDIEIALESVPPTFTVRARNKHKDLIIGHGKVALAPGYGAPNIQSASGNKRRSVIEDYRNFCKLAHTSDVVNVTGFLMCDPSDLPPTSYHLDMLFENMTLSDQPFMGSPLSGATALDSVRMAEIIFGNIELPVMVSNINSLPPLQFSGDMAEALIIFAKYKQPVIITGGGILGSTAPVKVAGLLAMQNASILAGIVLTQLVNPGTPVLYGAAGSMMDMQNGSYYHASPEYLTALSGGVMMARNYNLPCRGGGGLTDSHALDYQAALQSCLNLSYSFNNNIDFILHAVGILSSYLGMSYEKFIADEEIIRFFVRAIACNTIDEETIDFETIKSVGVGGQFLTHKKTFECCRTEFYRSKLLSRLPYDEWRQLNDHKFKNKASVLVKERLSAYKRPDLNSRTERDLLDYISDRKKLLSNN